MTEADPILRAWHFKQLRWSLQALARAGSQQPALFPERAESADELAFDFEHWADLVGDVYAAELSAEQQAGLSAIRDKLTAMSRDNADFDLDLWTDSALRGSEHWVEIRAMASDALKAFDWLAEGVMELGSEAGIP